MNSTTNPISCDTKKLPRNGFSNSSVVQYYEDAREWFAEVAPSWPAGYMTWVEMPYAMQNQAANLAERWKCHIVFCAGKRWGVRVVTVSATAGKMFMAEALDKSEAVQ